MSDLPEPIEAELELSQAEERTANDDRRRPKRGRDSTFGPTTPRGEGDETKMIGSGLTPLAKKGRVQPDSTGPSPLTATPEDDDDEAEPSDPDSTRVEGEADRAEASTPPPSKAAQVDNEAASAPATPAQASKAAAVPATEGKDTRSIRRRVEALEWEDGAEPPTPGTADDADIPDASQAGSPSAEKDAEVSSLNEKDRVEIEADAEADAKVVDADEAAAVPSENVKIADVEDEKDEVKQERVALSPDEEVAPSPAVKEVAAEAAKEEEASATTSSTPPKAAPAKSTATGFTDFVGKPSPFSTFSSAASPFAAVAPPPPPPAEEQKPKTKSNISFGTSTAFSSSPTAAVASTSTTSPAPAPAAVEVTPSKPATSLPSAFNSSAASPFASFASTSGFATATTPQPKPMGSTNGFGAFSAATASPFASFKAAVKEGSEAEASESSGRKLGDPVEPQEAKRVFTEQETITGEEDEEVLHSVRSKLYAMVEGAWVERGAGPFKLNAVPRSETFAARLVMRADATHRLLLNAPLFSKFSIDQYQDKYVRFAVIEDKGPISYMLRLPNAIAAEAVVEAIRNRVALLPN